MLRHGLRGRPVKRVRGALNTTTNTVLSLVEDGLTLDQALQKAREMGVAEPNPELDLKGLDLAAKAAILSCTLGTPITIDEVEIEAAVDYRVETLARQAAAKGNRLRMVASIEQGTARVTLEELTPDDPLHQVKGKTNAAVVEAEAGTIAVYGPGGGPLPTAYSLLADLLQAIEADR